MHPKKPQNDQENLGSDCRLSYFGQRDTWWPSRETTWSCQRALLLPHAWHQGVAEETQLLLLWRVPRVTFAGRGWARGAHGTRALWLEGVGLNSHPDSVSWTVSLTVEMGQGGKELLRPL